ncbi:MAG: TolC family protein [bacterium]|nr:TolC family protein [bacterium]
MPSQLTWLTLLLGAFFVFVTSTAAAAEFQIYSLRHVAAALDSTSPILAEARWQLEQARAAVSSSRAFPNPTLFGSQETLDDAESSTERVAGLRQSLGFVWSLRPRLAAANAEVDAAQASYLETKHDLIAHVVQLAFDYDRLKRQFELMDSVLVRADQLAAAIAERRRIGDVAPYDEQRFQLEQVQLRRRKQELQTNASGVLLELVRLTGLPTERLANLALPLPPPTEFRSEDDAVQHALAARPELRRLEQHVAASKHALAQAKWNQLPDFSFGVGQRMLDPGPSGLYFEGELEIPLWNQRRNERNIARAELHLAELQRQRFELSVQAEARQAYRQLQIAERLQPSTDSTLPDSATVNMTRGVQLYLEGEMSAFELVDALRTNVEAQDAVLSLRNSLAVARAELRRAVGPIHWRNIRHEIPI